MQSEIDKVWAITDGIRQDVGAMKICLARLDERSALREREDSGRIARLETIEARLQRLDLKIAGAMGMVVLIAWGLQLLEPNI